MEEDGRDGGRATRGTEAGVGIRDFLAKRENAMATGSKEVRKICDPANFPDSFDSPVPSILRPKRNKDSERSKRFHQRGQEQQLQSMR